MKVESKVLYKIYLTSEELTTMFTGYRMLYPASDMAWFLRQVVDSRHRAGELSDWLTTAEESAFENISDLARDLKSALLSAVAHDQSATVTVGMV